MSKRYLYPPPHVYHCIIYNSQDMVTTRESINGWMDKENVICIQSHTQWEKGNLAICINLKGITLSKISEKWKSQSCQTLWDPLDCTVCGILQAKILEWVAVPFSRGSYQPKDGTQVSLIASRFFTSWATQFQKEKDKYCMTSFICELLRKKPQTQHICGY